MLHNVSLFTVQYYAQFIYHKIESIDCYKLNTPLMFLKCLSSYAQRGYFCREAVLPVVVAENDGVDDGVEVGVGHGVAELVQQLLLGVRPAHVSPQVILALEGSGTVGTAVVALGAVSRPDVLQQQLVLQECLAALCALVLLFLGDTFTRLPVGA